MTSLVYISTATILFSDAQLVTLLERSRKKNTQLGLTGMLLYNDGCFIQVLEGSNTAVHGMFNTIAADLRHHSVSQLVEREIEDRQFDDWAMAFQNLKDPSVHQIPGYSQFMNDCFDRETYSPSSDRAHKLLEVFRKNMTR
jgi:hypothetical protein